MEQSDKIEVEHFPHEHSYQQERIEGTHIKCGKVSESCFAVHGVSMRIIVEGNISTKQIFPSLHALPWPIEPSNYWQIYASFVKSISEIHTISTKPISKMRIWPDTDVMYQEDDAGIFHASVNGATATINLPTRQAHLCFTPNSLSQAQRLGRLVVLEILRYEGCFTVHAGLIEISGGAVLICGASGTGKSTLTTVWACIGNGRFMADDRCIIFRKDGMLWAGGIADVLGMCPNTVTLMAKLDVRLPSKAQQRDDKSFYNCHDFFLTICQNPYPLKALIFLDDISNNTEDICRCSQEEAFKRIWQGSFYPGTSRLMQAHFNLLSDLSTNIPAYLIQSKSDCKSTITKLDSLMSEHISPAYPIYPLPQQHSIRVSPYRANYATKMLCQMLSEPKSPQCSVPTDDEQWRDILWAADCNGLLPLLAVALDVDALLRRCGNPISNVLRVALRKASEARSIHIKALRRISDVFHTCNIKWAVVDGPSIAERFYKVAASRYYHRLCILVDPNKVDSAMESLHSLGFSILKEIPPHKFACDSEAVILKDSIRLYEICICAPRKNRLSFGCNVLFDVSEFLQTAETAFPGGIEISVVHESWQILLSCLNSVNDKQSDNFVNMYDVFLMSRLASQQVCDDVVTKAHRLHCITKVEQAVHQAYEVFAYNGPVKLRQSICRK